MTTFLLALVFVLYHHSTASTMIPLSIIALPLTMVVCAVLMVNYLSDLERPEEKIAFLLRRVRSVRSLVDKTMSFRVRRLLGSTLSDRRTLPYYADGQTIDGQPG